MPYNFDFAMSADVSPDVIVEMIKQAVETQVGRKVDRVELKLKQVQRGDQRETWLETVFEGAKVFFTNEPVTEVKPSAPFLKR